MKNVLTLLCLLFITQLSFSQSPKYDDLKILYADANYEKLAKVASGYTENDKTKKDVLFNVNDVDQAITILNEIAKPGSMILTLGAGDIWRFSDKYLKIMKTKLN